MFFVPITMYNLVRAMFGKEAFEQPTGRLRSNTKSDTMTKEGYGSGLESKNDATNRQTRDQYLEFTFYPTLKFKTLEELKWVARLELRVKSVPQLMRQGFHWGAANVREEEGYFLSNKGEVEETVEIGRIVVVAREVPALSSFRLHMLSPDMIAASCDRNEEGRYIYNYKFYAPEWNFNTIYDDKPLEGWWPWPKTKQQQEQKQGGNTTDWEKWDTEWSDM
ncbi:hypothetical protein PT974_09821 [Cladobotryum mycophilum]|uniref:Uncharacterized protein n=1 Tax=Cladobotryum mycophilum TaxID=491253 RepID=A0ABR0SH83_9HYPO